MKAITIRPSTKKRSRGLRKNSLFIGWSMRMGDETTAHETGIFLYKSTTAEGKPIEEYVHFEGLLIKTDRWRILMEYQKSKATKAEWDALK